MQVTNETFPAVYEHFVSLLQTCDFYAFDEEMTGIADLERTENITDTPEDSYASKRRVAQRYSLIQVGICLFHKEDKEQGEKKDNLTSTEQEQEKQQQQQQHYVARPFNFHIFPDSNDDMLSEAERIRDVVMNPSTLHFLRKHNMNFQSWIYSGIRCCNKIQEKALRSKLTQEGDNNNSNSNSSNNNDMMDKSKLMSLLTDEEQKWVREGEEAAATLQQRFDEALAEIEQQQQQQQATSLNQPEEQSSSTSINTNKTAASSSSSTSHVCKEMLLLATSSRAARDALRDIIWASYPRIHLSFRRQGSSVGVLLTVLTEHELANRRENDTLRQRRALLDTLGFRLIFTALVESRKPCVGHNCFADLLFLMDTFDEPLPMTLTAWKAKIRELFPVIFDTRYLASHRALFASSRFPAMYLGGLFKEYGMKSKFVKLTLPLGFESYDPLTLIPRARGGGGGNNNNNSGSNRSGGGAAFIASNTSNNSSGGVSGYVGGNNDPQHEAGYDALMTGCVLLNLLAELGFTNGIDSNDSSNTINLENRLAIFRSLYAIDITSDDSDEYLACDVIDLTHDESISTNQLASCLSNCEQYEAQLLTVDTKRTLALLPDLGEAQANTLASTMSLRYAAHLSATVYKPPHVLGAMKAVVRKALLRH